MLFGKSSYSQQSLQDLESLDAFGTLSKSGCDMAIYQEEIQRQRSNRSLSLRRFNNVSSSLGARSVGSVIQSNSIMFDASYALEVFNNPPTSSSPERDVQSFENYLDTIRKFCIKNPRAIKQSFNNSELVNSFSNLVSGDLPEKTLCIVLQIMSCVFPLCDKFQVLFVDNLYFFFNDLVKSSSQEVCICSLSLITVISNFSSYGRNAFLTLETHKEISDLLLGILKDLPEDYAEGNIEHVIDIATDSLYHIFANKTEIDNEILTAFIPDIVHILKSLNPLMKSSLNSVIMTMVEISNKHPSLVSKYYEMDLFPLFIQLLDDPDLAGSALCLIGNCCGATPSQIRKLLDEGLIDYLLKFFETEYATDSFWIFSNLLQSVQKEILPIVLNEEFIQNVITIASSASFDLKKEASFLLSTIIIKSDLTDVKPFITSDIFNIFTDMLSCGDYNIIERCLSTFAKFLSAAVHEGSATCSQLIEIVSTSDLLSTLTELAEEKSNDISGKAEALNRQLIALQGEG